MAKTKIQKGTTLEARRTGTTKEVIGFADARSRARLRDLDTGKETTHRLDGLLKNYRPLEA